MSQKAQTPSSRLTRSIKAMSSPYPLFAPDQDWDDPKIWAVEARKAFSPTDLDKTVETAFLKLVSILAILTIGVYF